jgi:hypothetical protein
MVAIASTLAALTRFPRNNRPTVSALTPASFAMAALVRLSRAFAALSRLIPPELDKKVRGLDGIAEYGISVILYLSQDKLASKQLLFQGC